MNQLATVAHEKSVTRQAKQGKRKWTDLGGMKKKMTDNSFFHL